MREERITISKGLAIIFMVVCHAGLPYHLNHFINMFHMPLFFFVSGYCFKDKYLHNSFLFIKNKVKGLYVPFIKWSLLFLLLHNVFYYCNIYNSVFGGVNLYFLKDFILNAARLVFTMSETEQLLGGYWFLKQLFIGSIISLFVFNFLSKRLFIGAIFVLFATIITSMANMNLPIFHITYLSFLSTFFIVMGRVYKQYKYKFEGVYSSLLCFILVVFGSLFCGRSMLSCSTTDIIPYTLFALMGIIMMLNLSHMLSLKENCLKKIILLVGDHTLEVLTWHFLSFKIVSLLLVYMYGLPFEQIACFPVIPELSDLYWPLYAAVGVLVPIFVVYVKKKRI